VCGDNVEHKGILEAEHWSFRDLKKLPLLPSLALFEHFSPVFKVSGQITATKSLFYEKI
jgi:hypothetical protein